jgi:hypothetical protein
MGPMASVHTAESRAWLMSEEGENTSIALEWEGIVTQSLTLALGRKSFMLRMRVGQDGDILFFLAN